MQKLAIMVLSAITLTGCFQTKTLDPNLLTYQESQNVLRMERGVVIAVEQAMIQIQGSDDYAAVGTVLGGVLGSTIGKGSGRTVGAGIGALAGGVAGKMGTAKTEQGFVYTVELQKGGIIQVSQSGNMISQASKVFIKYFPENRKTISLDQSQGVTFSTAKKTSYAEKDAATLIAADNAAKAAAEKKRRATATANANAKVKAKADARNDENYELQMEIKRLELENKKLELERKNIRIKHEEEFIDKELEEDGASLRGSLLDIFK